MKPDVLIEIVETELLSCAKKMLEARRDLRCVIDRQTGDIKLFAKMMVAERVTNKHDEISLAAARKVKAAAQVGEEIEIDVTPKDLGQIAAQTAKRAIVGKLRAAEGEEC